MDFIKEKSWNIKTTKPFIKNPLGYVFYQCDTIKKKKQFWFWPKMTDYEFFCEKSSNLALFWLQKGIKGRRNFWPEFFFFSIGHRVYLQAHRTLNPYVRYLGKILKFVRGGGRPFPPPAYFPNPDYSQKILKRDTFCNQVTLIAFQICFFILIRLAVQLRLNYCKYRREIFFF